MNPVSLNFHSKYAFNQDTFFFKAVGASFLLYVRSFSVIFPLVLHNGAEIREHNTHTRITGGMTQPILLKVCLQDCKSD